MDKFELISPYNMGEDQQRCVKNIVENFNSGKKRQTLLGATGTGKTFTICNIIKNMGKKTLILAHNKTLAGQLYSEIKEFFPNNHVEFFISYYDYYQPEAYVASSDTYIEKDAKINDEIDQLRHSATSSLIDYEDVIVVSSVSCIYGIGDKDEYKKSVFSLRLNERISKKKVIEKLIELLYSRNDFEYKRSSFRSIGEILDIIPPYETKHGIRVEFDFDEIVAIYKFSLVTGEVYERLKYINIFAATHFMTNKERLNESIRRIKEELDAQVLFFENSQKFIEAQRIKQRTMYDISMLEEIGTCLGIENYSRHLSLKKEGERPDTLIDFFGDDFLLIVDESHVTLPQVRGMYNGDRARKENLVNYGFRLKSALDNRPLRFNEFESILDKALFVSATPGDYELDYPISEQIIRPTGLLDPIIEIRPTLGQVEDIYNEIKKRSKLNERVLITTLTIKMSEDLCNYLKKLDVNVCYLHSKIKSLERLEILRDLRLKKYDCLIGINLLREGLDLPEVSLVCILDADKQGFLRSDKSLIQTIGRAARNSNGKVIMYADSISDSMEKAISETKRRRDIQTKYNITHNITPKTIIKKIPESIKIKEKICFDNSDFSNLNSSNIKDKLKELEDLMYEYAKNLDFEQASKTRDLLFDLKKRYNIK